MGGSLKLTLSDMGKIGLLMLNNGKWDNKQVISSKWIGEITRELEETEPSWIRHNFYHHYLWWQFNEVINNIQIRAFYASGNGGQTIMFIPELKAVIAITTENYNSPLEAQSIQMIREAILPALYFL